MEGRTRAGLGPFYSRAQAVTAGELAVLNRIGAGLNWVLVADTVRGKKHEDTTAPNCSFQKYFAVSWPPARAPDTTINARAPSIISYIHLRRPSTAHADRH